VLALRSVRLRLTLWYVLLLAMILAAFSAGIYLTLRHNLYANLDNSLESRTNDLLPLVRYQGTSPTLSESITANSPDLGEQFVRVYDTSGQLTFDDSGEAGAVPVDREAVQSALAGGTHTRGISVGGEPFRVRIVPIEQNGRLAGALEVGRAAGDASDTLSTLLLILGIAYPVTLAVASLGGIFLAGRALSPIDRLTRLARRISAEDLSQRLDLRLPDDEVGRLARTFDEMIARLEDAFQRQRQFTADASHELRTPLTAIKGQAEVALSRPREAAAYREVLQTVNDEVDRLIRMVGSLLTLARADAGQIPIACEPVSLGDLVGAAAEQVRPMAEKRGLELHVAPDRSVLLQADEDLLLQLLLNLLDNAIKYTPAGGEVTVGWNQRGDQVALWVHDTGVGIDPEHLPHIFDRFYRADKARSRAEGGAGLGLSISRWIAGAHGGSISVESAPGKGATFTVKLPLNGHAFIS
jgi:heavy metal sensor kinase